MSGLKPPVGAHDHAKGSDTASVTLVEYGDYECPHCAVVHPIVKAVQRHFGHRLRFVFRNFPLTQVHPHADHAAEAAEAADPAGKYWDMHDAIFEHQTAITDRDLARYGEQVGLEPGVIEDALTAQTYAARVRADFMSGVRSGVNGTPMFFINGEQYQGGYDAASLIAGIEETAARG
jgi:protein-disulfide isomerase